MSEKSAKQRRKEEQFIRESFGINPEAAKQKNIPILGCPACQRSGEWNIVLDHFPPEAEKTVAIVCAGCRYFTTFVVDLKAARGLTPLEGEENVEGNTELSGCEGCRGQEEVRGSEERNEGIPRDEV